jgi:predicted metalloprotease with PDZ domain
MPMAGWIATTFLAITLAGCAAPGAGAPQPPPPAGDEAGTRYTISLTEPQTQMVDVAIHLDHVEGASIDFVLPTWRPGRYAILDFAGGVREVRASAADGSPLPVRKADKTTWRVTTTDARSLTLSYRVYANALGDRTRHVDDTHAFLDAASVLMFVPGRRALPVALEVRAPEGWAIATGLEHPADHPEILVAPNYDILADSPLEVGPHEVIRFDVDGTPHEIVLWGRRDAGRRDLPADFSRIIRAERDIFGDLPYHRYTFIIHCTPTVRGATEHLNSTVIQASGSVFDTASAYRGFLGLVAHEFFHTWNIKQLRPAEFKPYDYVHENYTPSLWIAEGMTSYFDSLCLVRAGLLEPDEYLEQRSDAIGSLLNAPGRSVQSLEEASFDAWIKFSRPSPDNPNSSVSFYGKGALVSLLLDLEIRRGSDNRVSLDDVMRQMYRAYPLSGPGYTADDFRAMAQRLSGADLADFFARYVAGTDELPLAEACSTLGLALNFEPDRDALREGKPDPSAYIGLDLSDRNGAAAVDTVRTDGPAYTAGVIAGDEIVALNGLRLRAADLSARLDTLNPGDPVRLTLFRRDELREVEFVAAGRPRGAWKLSRLAEPTRAQREAYQSWLKQPWPGSADESAPDGQSNP